MTSTGTIFSRGSKIAAKLVVGLDGLDPYEITMFSKMKYGDPISTKRIAIQVAAAVIQNKNILKRIQANEPIIVTSSAFGSVPTASYAITREVSKLLQSANINIDRIKIMRGGDFAVSHYGTMNQKERALSMSRRNIYIGTEDLKKIKGRLVLVVDDISVTGSHEKKVHQVLSNTDANDWVFAYYYILNKKIAKLSPETEEDLNRAEIKTVLDLLPFFRAYPENPGIKLRINSRVLKFILATEPESKYDVDAFTKEEHLKVFFKALDDETIAKIYRSTNSSDGYSINKKYSRGIRILNEEILQRSSLDRFFSKITSFLSSIPDSLEQLQPEYEVIN